MGGSKTDPAPARSAEGNGKGPEEIAGPGSGAGLELSLRSTTELFQEGNYAAVAMKGNRGNWRTYAALGLVGKTEEALAGLAGSDDPEAVFYSAVASWMEGDRDRAAALLQPLPLPQAQRLLALIRKPRIEVLGQLPWVAGSNADLLTGMKQDPAFHVQNIGFRRGDLPNEPDADIHEFYDPGAPPDFYICNMVEWHLIPNNLQQLPCPVFGQTADYELHIQVIHPWLALFDEILVNDPSEWRELRPISRGPVVTFPKAFRVPDGLPPIPDAARPVDFYMSGTSFHPYHPDKARLLHQVLSLPDLRLKIINGFNPPAVHYRHLAEAKVCISYVRHPTALPTRGLEALAMGCALLVQQDNVLTLFVGENEGVVSYDGEEALLPAVRSLLARWPEFQERARRGAEQIRRDFASRRVASQYLRFLTFLAARPRPARRPVPADQLFQKRPIVEKGWLPCLSFEPGHVLQQMGARNHARFRAEIDRGPASSRPFIDAARESVLFNFHLARARRIPLEEWLSGLSDFFRRGMAQFPQSLVLRFNCVRTLLHFGTPALVSEALQLLGDTLSRPTDHWTVDAMEDVFPYDFFPEYFNYRKYFDLVTESIRGGPTVAPLLCRLMLASLHFYRGFYAPYQDFHPGGLVDFRQARLLDPDFPFYKFYCADRLLARGLREDYPEAFALLAELAGGSLLFLEAVELLEQYYELPRPSRDEGGRRKDEGGKVLPPSSFLPHPCKARAERQGSLVKRPPLPPELARLAAIAARARGAIKFIERIALAPLQPDPRRAREQEKKLSEKLQQAQGWVPKLIEHLKRTRAEAEALRAHVRNMEGSKFWIIRKVWFRLKRAVGISSR
jgi:hypothetical protein